VTKPGATLVGVFVLGGITLIVAAVLFFGGGVLLEKRIPIVSFFRGSVAGLKVGAPVTFRGVLVGEVKSIGIRVNPDTGRSIVQVNMELLPETVAVYGPRLPADEHMVPALVRRGLTAQLVQQSFVTGLLSVDLDFRPGVEASRLGELAAVAEVPTVPSPLETITRKLEAVDIAVVLEAAQRTLTSLNGILTSPELTQTIRDLPALASGLRQTLGTIDREVARLSATGRDAISHSATALQKTLASVQTLAATLDREVARTLAEARGSLARANTTLDGANVLLDPNGRTVIQVQRAVDDLAATAARLRDLAERVDRDPSILVRGR
jgi:phospholipid/cholesterol/gamma-HCH transport system substrate-binding protein